MAAWIAPKDLAKRFGVARSTVTRWVKRGRLPVNDAGLIDAEMAAVLLGRTQALAPHHQARIAAHDMSRQALRQAAEPDGHDAASVWGASSDEIAARYKAAMAREREAKAELAAMEVDRQAGLLLDRQEVDFVMTDLGNVLRSRLEMAEDVLTERVLPLKGDASAIRQAVHEALREALEDISEHMRRRMAEVTA